MRLPLALMIAVVGLSAFGIRPVAPVVASSTLTRPEDPVVMTGADLPTFGGIAPNLLVAFQHDGAGWVQIPVQVDERDLKDFRAIYNDSIVAAGTMALQYTDANTWTGADSNATIDGNDEIAFMARDAGGEAPAFSEPPNVVSGTAVAVSVTDPLHPGQEGWVYLWRSDGSLDPGAGASYLTYNFGLNSGDYKLTYNLGNGPNPENSTTTTPAYTYHFGDRWQDDGLTVTAPGASPVDILDRHKPMFAPGVCVRTEDSFNDAEGAFVINKSGPVRAIRGFIGANSGPLTQRDHIFYAERQDVRTYLRVHSIGSIMDFMDYSPAAAGMTYYNNLNTGGVLVDGNPDAPVAGAPVWEVLDGAQGAVVQVGAVSTNWAGFNATSYYLDDTTPPVTQCTGDAFAYGASGSYVNPSGSPSIPNTDPSIGGTTFLNSTRFMYFKSPYGSAATAVAAANALSQQAVTPLVFSVGPFLGAGDVDGDTIDNTVDNCPSVPNMGQENADRNFIDLSPPKLYDDLTLAHSDELGDVCDSDDDNDGRADTDEAAGTGCGIFTTPTNPLMLDSDGDLITDGAECTLLRDPASIASEPMMADCVAFAPGDADGDGLPGFREFCNYGTSDNSADTDGDGCSEGPEIASINGDQIVSSVDLSQIAQMFGTKLMNPNYLSNFDFTRDNNINATDLSQVAQRFGACA